MAVKRPDVNCLWVRSEVWKLHDSRRRSDGQIGATVEEAEHAPLGPESRRGPRKVRCEPQHCGVRRRREGGRPTATMGRDDVVLMKCTDALAALSAHNFPTV